VPCVTDALSIIGTLPVAKIIWFDEDAAADVALPVAEMLSVDILFHVVVVLPVAKVIWAAGKLPAGTAVSVSEAVHDIEAVSVLNVLSVLEMLPFDELCE
jgi:hypothetical protein